MNCDDFEKQVLLEQSGELDEGGRALLEQHQAHCSRCRAYRATAMDIVDAARTTLPAEPGADTLRQIRIRAAARTRSPVMLLYRPRVQALACAATLLLAVGGWLLLAPRNGEMRMRDMNTIITMMMDEEMIAEQPDTGEGSTDLRALAELLLKMEESAVDGSTNQEEQPWELDSRVPRWRSRSEALPEIYG